MWLGRVKRASAPAPSSLPETLVLPASTLTAFVTVLSV
jgi:hypothetical protein